MAHPEAVCQLRVNSHQRLFGSREGEKQVKRIYLAMAIAAISVVAVSALASASASATVLCNWAPVYHECGPSGIYGAGTEVKASLVPGTEARFHTKEGTTLVSCADSTLNTTTTSSTGGNIPSTVSTYTFSSCSTGGITVVRPGAQSFTWIEGTHNGVAVGQNEMSLSTLFGKCRVLLGGFGEVIGGSAPRIVYRAGEVTRLDYSLCPRVTAFTAQYNVTSPTPLFVEQK
jgi:hypothetical protein